MLLPPAASCPPRGAPRPDKPPRLPLQGLALRPPPLQGSNSLARPLRQLPPAGSHLPPLPVQPLVVGAASAPLAPARPLVPVGLGCTGAGRWHLVPVRLCCPAAGTLPVCDNHGHWRAAPPGRAPSARSRAQVNTQAEPQATAQRSRPAAGESTAAELRFEFLLIVGIYSLEGRQRGRRLRGLPARCLFYFSFLFFFFFFPSFFTKKKKKETNPNDPKPASIGFTIEKFRQSRDSSTSGITQKNKGRGKGGKAVRLKLCTSYIHINTQTLLTKTQGQHLRAEKRLPYVIALNSPALRCRPRQTKSRLALIAARSRLPRRQVCLIAITAASGRPPSRLLGMLPGSPVRARLQAPRDPRQPRDRAGAGGPTSQRQAFTTSPPM